MQVKDLQLKRALRIALFVLLLVAGTSSYAERVEPEVARAVAATFLNNNGVRSNQLTDLSERAGFSNLYIFNGEESFVILAADDRVKPILGYSLTGQFVVENTPEDLRWWLQGYNDEIQYAIDNQVRVASNVAHEWEDLRNCSPNKSVMTTIVEPLIESTWGQSDGYNEMCPYDIDSAEFTLTGCVATAMAQIMRYWGHPSVGTGSHGYYDPVYGYQSANFGNTTYNWSDMPLDYSNSEIAKLMRHCGVSINTHYGVAASSAYDDDVPYALKTYFGYSTDAVYEERNQLNNDTEWVRRMKAELDAGRPMLYGGQSSDDNSVAIGHAFICDGYNSNDYFHFNWGWWGLYQDTYFSINAMSPDGENNFNYNQDAVFGIQPVVIIGDLKYALSKSTAKVVGHKDGTSASGSLTIPSSVTYTNTLGQTRTYEVVSIGAYAFSGCSGLTDLTIGNSVTSIGGSAFRNCSGLTDLTIPNSVTSIGEDAFSGCSGLTTVNWDAVNVTSYPTSTGYHPFTNCTNLTTVVFGNQVQTIPNYAFNGCSGLTGSLTIPNSVTSIGASAFSGCSGLTTVNWNAVDVTSCTFPYPFMNCTNLATVVFGDQVQTIPNCAFYGCSGLTGSLTIPNSVTSIGSWAFKGCSGLTGLTIGNSVTSIGNLAFDGCNGLTTVNWNAVNITSYPTSTGDYPFRNCTNLTTVVFGNQVQTIPNYAFYGCIGLTTVNWNAVSVTSYPFINNPFSNCTNLATVVFGDQVQTIPDYAFCNCSSLIALTIGNSVTSIGYYAFNNCSGLTDLTIGNSVSSIGGFYDCSGLESVNYTGDIAQWCNIEFLFPLYYAHNLYIEDELVTNLEIPESVTEIKNYAFSGCSCLTSLTIPNSVTSIGNSAFYNCSGLEAVYYTGDIAQWCNIGFGGYSSNPLYYAHNLYIDDELVTNLVIPESVTEIKNYTFYNCNALTGTLNIGSSVATIGYSAFSNCTGIHAIRMQCPAPPTIYQNSFNGVDKSIPVFVACGTQEAYMSADYWPEFTVINESPYNLIITQNDPYGGEVSVVHYADCDDNHCAILAINNIGYNFIGWFVNDYFSTDSPYCDFSLIDNVTFEARFERKPNHFITIVTSTSNTWSDPDTWDTGEVPSSTSTVGIYKDIIVDVNAEVEQMGIYDDGTITISPDVALTVTDTLGSDNVASIVIEDGGQLIHSSDEAMATVKKSIEPYTTNADGWNLISFPLTGNGTVASIGNMLDNQYDLYAYDEPTQYWINQKEESNGFTALESGQGYLYANKGTGMGLAAGSKIGEGTSTIGYTPFYTYYEYTIAENLFLASELEAAGLPTTALGGLCWYATNQTSYLQSNISIWMANVNDEALTTTSHNVSNMTLVYTGDMTPVVGWNSFVFNENNFTWDGTSNVLVCVQRNNGTYNSTVYWQAHNPGFAATSYKYNTSSAYDMTSGTYSMNVSSSLRLNTVFQTLEQVGQFEYYEPITMSFAGEMENGSATVTVPLSYTETAGNLKGFNLVGNPFVHNVTSYGSTNVADGCFRLNETKDNLIVSEVSETQPLKPAEGFFVKATDVGASITFNLGRSRGENERKGFVNLELRENGKLIDRLIVKREGEPLEKLSLKGNSTRLYAMQNKQEVAIVSCDDNEQPVNFKATKNGSYMITASLDNMAVDFLHLIDNLTGADVDLLVEPSYTFEAKTTDYASRFKLVFSVSGDADGDDAPFAFINNGNIIIVGAEACSVLQIVDVMGRVLVSTDNVRNVSTNGMAKGVYILRLINGDDVRTQKIVVD